MNIPPKSTLLWPWQQGGHGAQPPFLIYPHLLYDSFYNVFFFNLQRLPFIHLCPFFTFLLVEKNTVCELAEDWPRDEDVNSPPPSHLYSRMRCSISAPNSVAQWFPTFIHLCIYLFFYQTFLENLLCKQYYVRCYYVGVWRNEEVIIPILKKENRVVRATSCNSVSVSGSNPLAVYQEGLGIW